METAISIDGLSPFVRAVGKLDSDLPKMVRLGFNSAMSVVVDYGKHEMPRRTGRAAASIKAASTRTAGRVSEGGGKTGYVPWLDFGGRTGPNRSVGRRYVKGGRYLYPALGKKSDEIQAGLSDALRQVVEAAGLEMD